MTEFDPKDAEARLARFFAEDGLAERDPVFSAAVTEAIARRRFLRSLAGLAGVAALAALVLWAMWRAVAPEAAAIASGLAPVALAAVMLGSLYLGLATMLRRA